MARIIGVDGEVTDVEPADGCQFTVAEMQQLVGGEVGIIRTDLGARMAIDEDARAKGLELNRRATMLAGQFVIGPAVLLKQGEFKRQRDLVAV